MKKRTIEIPIKKIFCVFLSILIIYYGGLKIWAATVETTPITFTDNNLYQTLKTMLSKYIIDKDDSTKTLEIRTDGIPEITELDLSNSQISNLSGIENFTSLKKLNLSKNLISNVSNLATLNNLETLNLSNNNIGSINDIKNLNLLIDLNLSSNKISDISAVSGMFKLQTLDVSNNAISTAKAVKSLSNLTSLNVSQNSSLANLSDVIMSQLTVLNVSNTAITNIEGITECNRLIELNLSNNNIDSLSPLFETERVDDETVAILRTLQKLNVSYTTTSSSGLSFSNIKRLTNLKEIYAQGNNISNVSGIAEMKDLEYVNLDDNRISNISYFRTTETKDGNVVTKDLINATQISLANNEISDISVFDYIDSIEYLDLSGNHIQNVSSLEGLGFSKGLNLRNQTIDMNIYQKKNNENHYVILLNIMQSAKNPESIIYDANAYFSTEGVEVNTDQTYNVAPYYNVIISPDKTSKDSLSITLHGGKADGTKINFKMSTSSSAIDTLQFEDPNLDAAIYKYLLERLSNSSYIARAPKIINITQREIANVRELDISNAQIQNLKGLSNFNNIEILNLSNNEVSDDSEIRYLEKIEVLNFANNKLNNSYKSIEVLYDLQNLDLSGNNIQDLNSINQYVANLELEKEDSKLTDLTLANNNLENIETLSKLSTLKKLNISNNKIVDISYIGTNTVLDTLNISGNDIENIDVISNLRNIKTLNMANNLIENIQVLRNLSLTSLDVSGNRISDITSLSTQTGLTELYLNNNKVDDVSPIEGLLLRGVFEAKQQKLTHILDDESEGVITLELPEIFKSARNPSSKVYTSEEFKLENCELTSDGNSIQVNIDELGETKIARITIVGGQAEKTTFSVAEPLKATITYSPNQKTKENVIATITFNRSGARILNNEGNNTYTFETNGEFTFIYQDEYGFEGEETASVNWIDKEGPKATVKYSNEQITKDDVEVTISTDEKVANQLEGWEFTNDTNTEMKKTYSRNIEETINIQDELGNNTEVGISIKNIDKDSPKITNIENGKTYDKSVIPNIEDENLDIITLTKDGTKINYVAGEEIIANGEYVLTVTDKAGNQTTVEFTIEKEELDDTIKSEDYEINIESLKITKIPQKTQASSFKDKISTEIGYRIENLQGVEIGNTDIIGTGYTLITDSGKSYKLVVTGDVNGDGQVKITDLSNAKKHYLNIETLQGIYKDAIDLDYNGTISLKDIAQMRNIILGL